MSEQHKMTDVAQVREFVTAGNSTFTLRSIRTGVRFTYKVRLADDQRVSFVGLLTGSDNTTNYAYLGTLRDNVYAHGRKSRIGADAASVKGFEWFWRTVVERGILPDSIEFWHEGKCGRCGRKLTVPESIESGLGPDCAAQMGEHRHAA